jgi:hypothetical protein
LGSVLSAFTHSLSVSIKLCCCFAKRRRGKKQRRKEGGGGGRKEEEERGKEPMLYRAFRGEDGKWKVDCALKNG